MRPEKAYRKVRNALYYWYETKDISKLLILEKEVEKLLHVQKIWYINYNLKNPEYPIEFDTRTDLGGYSAWKSEMDYISDRFNATHRLRWLLVGLQNGEFK